MNQINKTIFSVPNSSELEQLTELHKAMGDYTRMKILWHLMKQEYCVSELAKKSKSLNLPYPTSYTNFALQG